MFKLFFQTRSVMMYHSASSDNNFCLDSTLHLKPSHRYYTQVQLQMYLSECEYCDFVVYTKCNPSASMVIVRVPLDINFCQALVNKCELSIKTHVIKELITRELENQPTSPPTEENNNKQTTWLTCAEPEYGRMMKCDNSDCHYIWLHYKCVNIRRKPKGKWYCVSCEQYEFAKMCSVLQTLLSNMFYVFVLN